MEHDILGRSIGRFPGVTEKGSPVFPDGISQTQIRVAFIQSHL